MKAVFAVWNDIKVSQLNRLLRPYNVRLVVKSSRDWGDRVTVTAHGVEPPKAPAEGAPSGNPS